MKTERFTITVQKSTNDNGTYFWNFSMENPVEVTDLERCSFKASHLMRNMSELKWLMKELEKQLSI